MTARRVVPVLVIGVAAMLAVWWWRGHSPPDRRAPATVGSAASVSSRSMAHRSTDSMAPVQRGTTRKTVSVPIVQN